jgi:beta-barrel assembly-enhancing protease
LNNRTHAIGLASLAAIFLLPAVITGQVKRSKSDADVSAIGHRKIDQGTNIYTPQKEKELGNKLALEIDKSYRFITDISITQFVERIAQNVQRNSDKHIPITIKLIDSDEVKAFTLPGGHQYITRGLLLTLENEGELASALARGIAHTALRSGTKIATRAEMSQLAGVMITPPLETSTRAIGASLVELKAKREAEFDADYFGVQYLYKSGYDTKCFLDFIARSGNGDKTVPETFREFPPVAQRLQALEQEIAQILPRRDGAVTSTKEFQDFTDSLQKYSAKDSQ